RALPAPTSFVRKVAPRLSTTHPPVAPQQAVLQTAPATLPTRRDCPAPTKAELPDQNAAPGCVARPFRGPPSSPCSSTSAPRCHTHSVSAGPGQFPDPLQRSVPTP